MSFGQPTPRTARPAAGAPCPCGSGQTYDRCCGPLHRGEAAPTAERLMRSRYCAFAIGDARYLADTWHPRTRPSELTIDAALRWTGLRIVDTVRGAAGDADGIVEFRARWSGLGERGELHERSRFVHQRHRWWYVDGDVAD